MRPEEKPDIKLVTIDIDRTLVDDERNVPNENKEAIQSAIAKGCNVVLCSGRSGASVRNYMELLGLHCMVPSLGGCMLATWEGEVINDYGIDCESAVAIYDIARKYDCYPYVFKGEGWLSDPENEFWNKREFEMTGIEGKFLDIRSFIKDNKPNKMLFPSLDSKKLEDAMVELQKSLGDKIVCFLSSPFYLEVLPRGINKGTAVNDLIKFFNIKKENVLAIGDYYNDVDMFLAAGNKAAVLNSPDDIKAMVDYVSSVDNNHGAVAEVIDKYVLCR